MGTAQAISRTGSEEGATAVEYALMAMLIAMVVIAAVAALGRSTSDALCPSGGDWELVESFDSADC